MDHVHRVQDGAVGQKLKDMVTAKGFVALSYWDNAFKQLSTSKDKPLLMPSDAKGQKFRIMSSKVLESSISKASRSKSHKVMPF